MLYCFKYRIYPDQSQRETLDSAFEACRLLYNGCLEERINHYKKFQKGISYNEQSAQLPEIKKQGWFVGIHSQTIQEVLKRLDKAFQAFFKRVKNGEEPGFPRFKKYGRFRSIVFPQPNPELKGPGGISLHGKKLKVFGIEKLIPVNCINRSRRERLANKPESFETVTNILSSLPLMEGERSKLNPQET